MIMMMFNKIKFNGALRTLIKIAAVLFGSFLYAAAIQYFLIPNDIPMGGISGIAMIINRFTDWPVGIMIIAMNVPLFLISAKKLGVQFMVASLFGMIASSVMIDVLAARPHVLTTDPFLTCIYGGILLGIGLGIVYRAGATTGGSDIIAKLMRKKYAHINLGTFILIIDILIIGTYAIVFDKWESALYALIAMFLGSKLIDIVLYGASASKMCYIISDHSEEVKSFILEKLDKGVTILDGYGGYSGDKKKVLLCVIHPRQIVEIRAAVKNIAPDAFIIITDAKEVFGQGFSDVSDIS